MPKTTFFKPQGISLADVEVIKLTREEAEALRLKDIEGLDQTEAAKSMGISQSSFQRILALAHKKTSEALIGGKAIRVVRRDG